MSVQINDRFYPIVFVQDRWTNLEPLKAFAAFGIGALALPYIIRSLGFRREGPEANRYIFCIVLIVAN